MIPGGVSFGAKQQQTLLVELPSDSAACYNLSSALLSGSKGAVAIVIVGGVGSV